MALQWVKGSRSNQGDCVEVAKLPDGGVTVRNSNDPGQTPLTFTRREWDAMIDSVRDGELGYEQLP